jgi:hypothetical protein
MDRFVLTYTFLKNKLFSHEPHACTPFPSPILSLTFPGSIRKTYKLMEGAE